MPIDNQTNIDTGSTVGSGARLELDYRVRLMKVYAVHGSELESVGLFNTIITTLVGVISLIVGLLLSSF